MEWEILEPQYTLGTTQNYFHELADIVQLMLPSNRPTPDKGLMEDFGNYLRGLTDKIEPMDRDLFDRLVSYASEVAVDVDGIESFKEIAEEAWTTVFQGMSIDDFTPLDPDGVDHVVAYSTLGKFAESLKLLLEALALLNKAKEFGTKRSALLVATEKRLDGPFQILSIGKMNFFQDFKFDQINSNGQQKVVSIKKTLTVPKNTLAVSAEVSGMTILLTTGSVDPTNGSVSGQVIATHHVGPVSFDIATTFNPVSSNKAELEALVVNHFAKDGAPDENLIVRFSLQLKYYGKA